MEIKTPKLYINEENATEKTGEILRGKVKKALIIYTKSAKKKAASKIENSLSDNDIEYKSVVFEGFPTIEKAKEYAKIIEEGAFDAVIGAGGGKTLDITKAAGNLADVTIITVPTIAATCAAWAAVSIIYDETGDFSQFFRNKKTADIVIADTRIIVDAPVRYIKAGMIDTMAKWYETSLGSSEDDDFSNILAVSNSKIALDYLLEHSVEVIGKVQKGIIDNAVKKVIDTIIYIAGNVGSYVGEKSYMGFAHPFYHSARRIPETKNSLHGEIVAYGLLVQAVLEKRSDAYIRKLINIFTSIDEDFTSEEIGLGWDTNHKLEIITDRIFELFGASVLLKDNKDKNIIIDAVKKVDKLVYEQRGEKAWIS